MFMGTTYNHFLKEYSLHFQLIRKKSYGQFNTTHMISRLLKAEELTRMSSSEKWSDWFWSVLAIIVFLNLATAQMT